MTCSGAFATSGLLAATSMCLGSVLETTGGMPNAIEVSNAFGPSALTGTPSTFTLLSWVRRSSWSDGAYANVLTLGSALTLGFDDDADGVRVRMDGAASAIDTLIPLRDDSPDAKVPVDEWMLIACTWDAESRTLTSWAQSETVARVSASATDPKISLNPAWPVTLGSTESAPSFAGHLGLTAVRRDLITGDDFDLIWNGGKPNYFAPALLEAGSLTGFEGLAWMVGHSVPASPYTVINPFAQAAELGDTVNENNLTMYYEVLSSADAVLFYTPGRIDSVTGDWLIRSPHE